MSRRLKILGSAALVVGIALLVALNWSAIVDRYLPEPISFLRRGSKSGMILNLMGVAIPAHIIPVFHLVFARDPQSRVFHPVFGTTPGDIALTAVGFGISLLMFYGMWRARHRFIPEIWYFLGALPVLTVMIPSTRRYLMAYEPFIWLFFYAGVAAVLRPLLKRIKVPTISPVAALALLLVVALGLLFVRSQRLVGTAGDRRAGISIGQTRGYVDEVVSTFGDLRQFLDTLPRDRSLLVGAYGTVGRWTAISGLKYYSPDSALSVAARERDVYVLVECGTLEICQDFENWDSAFRGGIDRHGQFSYERVFSHLSRHAKARVYRLRNLQ